MKKIGWALGIVLMAAGITQAATIDWDGGGIDTEWNTTNNWDEAYLPGATATDTVRIMQGDVATVNSAVTSPNAVKVLLRNGGSLTVKADMDSLSAIDIAKASSTAGTASQFTQSGAGTVTVSGAVIIGGDEDSTGKYRQTAGTLNAGSITVQANGTYQTIGNNNTKSVTTASMTIQNGGVADFGGQQLTVNATALNVGATGAGTVNQTGAGSAVTSAGLNVGAEGTYNLNGGTLTSAGNATVDGSMVIDGGTFTLATDGNNDISVNGLGLLELKSGTLNDNTTEAGSFTRFAADVVISGGEVDFGGQLRLNGGEFRVIGDAATLSLDRIQDTNTGDFVFEFGVDGISTITSSLFLELAGSSVTVEVGAYAGENGDFVLFDASAAGEGGFKAISTDLDVSSFIEAGYTGTWIEQDQDSDLVTLHVIPEPATFGLVVAFGCGMLFIRRMFQM